MCKSIEISGTEIIKNQNLSILLVYVNDSSREHKILGLSLIQSNSVRHFQIKERGQLFKEKEMCLKIDKIWLQLCIGQNDECELYVYKKIAKTKYLISRERDRRANTLEKTLMLGMIGDKRRRGQQKMRQLESNTGSMDMNLSKLCKQ